MDKKDLYFSLRDEINYNQNQENEMTRFAYTVIVAVFGTALTVKNKWITLLSLVIIIPISFRVARYRDSIAYISTYMKVFLEPELEFKWEHDHDIYSEKYRSSYFSKFLYFVSRADFLFLTVIGIAIFWIQNQGIHLKDLSWTIILIIFQIIMIIIEIILFNKFSNIPNLKKSKIENWKKIHSEKSESPQ